MTFVAKDGINLDNYKVATTFNTFLKKAVGNLNKTKSRNSLEVNNITTHDYNDISIVYEYVWDK